MRIRPAPQAGQQDRMAKKLDAQIAWSATDTIEARM